MTEDLNDQIQILSDLEAISHQAASLFVKAARDAIDRKTRFVAAISGGSTPRRLYTLLGSAEYSSPVDWQRVHFFWVDERCVPKDHEESNFKTAFDALLSKIPIPDENIHRIRGEEDPERGARDYEEDIRKFFGMSGLPMFDLVILGMGEDGHTASLFPGSKALGEKERWVVPVYLEKPKINRITLTLPVLNHAAQILFLVSGRSKATVLFEILGDGHKKDQYPAGLIRPIQGRLLWLIDQEASGKLKRQGECC
jgi:6-phosphogluconolactonase